MNAEVMWRAEATTRQPTTTLMVIAWIEGPYWSTSRLSTISRAPIASTPAISTTVAPHLTHPTAWVNRVMASSGGATGLVGGRTAPGSCASTVTTSITTAGSGHEGVDAGPGEHDRQAAADDAGHRALHFVTASR